MRRIIVSIIVIAGLFFVFFNNSEETKPKSLNIRRQYSSDWEKELIMRSEDMDCGEKSTWKNFDCPKLEVIDRLVNDDKIKYSYSVTVFELDKDNILNGYLDSHNFAIYGANTKYISSEGFLDAKKKCLSLVDRDHSYVVKQTILGSEISERYIFFEDDGKDIHCIFEGHHNWW